MLNTGMASIRYFLGAACESGVQTGSQPVLNWLYQCAGPGSSSGLIKSVGFIFVGWSFGVICVFHN